ncbi:MAG: CHAT domain-containing tetratricopeptide repeat protein [Ilumatobacteraceae bacterium]
MTVDTDFPGNGPTVSVSLRLDLLENLVQADPRRAIAEARDLLASAEENVSEMLAWSIIGRSLNELGDTERAAAAMRRAIQIGEAPVSAAQLTSIRISAAAILADSGDHAAALFQLTTAEEESSEEMLARVQSQRAYILTNAGRLLEARRQADLAVASAGKRGDSLERLRILLIRSFVLLQIGDLRHAEADLIVAGRLASGLGQIVTSALIIGNLGVVHARAGRTAVAMQHFDRALGIYVSAGSPLRTMAILETDRAEMLVRSGLYDDAVTAAKRAVTYSTESRNVVSRGDSELLLARAYLAAGHLVSAQQAAGSAAGLLREGRRNEIALQARAIGIQAALGLAASERDALRLFGRSIRLGARLERAGWGEFSDDLRSARLRSASRLGILHDVSDDLVRLRRSIRSRRPAEALRAWHAETLARSLGGDHRTAIVAARRGMQALERFRDSTNDLQIRAGLSAIGDDLAGLAIHLALETRSPSTTLTWAERTRAHAYGVAEFGPVARPRLSEIAAEVGPRVLVEFVIDGDEVWAVVVRHRRSRLVHVGSAIEIIKVLDRVVAWLDRAVQPEMLGARTAMARSATARLAGLLIAPLGLPLTGDLIIVPVGQLHAVPWSAIAGRGRCLVVNLSARAWAVSANRESSTQSTAMVIGPAVAGAAIERAAMRRLDGSASTRTGARATAVALRKVLETRDLVHIAAHGIFDADHPLRSTLRLTDGEMPIFDLNDIAVACKLVVMSSCEAGVHRVNPGGEVLGLVGILLSRGADTVIAPTHTVPDMTCAEFVSEFYEAWSHGTTAAAALTVVRSKWLESESIFRWATAAAFTCFGSGTATFRSSVVVSGGPS